MPTVHLDGLGRGLEESFQAAYGEQSRRCSGHCVIGVSSLVLVHVFWRQEKEARSEGVNRGYGPELGQACPTYGDTARSAPGPWSKSSECVPMTVLGKVTRSPKNESGKSAAYFNLSGPALTSSRPCLA